MSFNFYRKQNTHARDVNLNEQQKADLVYV